MVVYFGYTKVAYSSFKNIDNFIVDLITMSGFNINLGFLFIVSFILSFHSPTIISSASKLEISKKDVVPYSYMEETGKGPSKWSEIDSKWGACGVGKIQSPIDFQDRNVKVAPKLGELQKNYKPANAAIVSRGRDVMVTWKEDPGNLVINGTAYTLKDLHWHTPSEHSINGRRYEAELHLVHNSSEGQLAVLGILYQYGQPDSFLSKMLPYIKSVTKQEKDLGIVNPTEEIVFGSRQYYLYNGSFSIPPCNEGVIWTIIKKVRTVSIEQVQVLKDAADDGFQTNARPTQLLNGRDVYVYNPWEI